LQAGKTKIERTTKAARRNTRPMTEYLARQRKSKLIHLKHDK
jgi:hypothetical protein